MKSCNVFKTKEYYKIITKSETEDGFLLSTFPVFVIDVNSDNQELLEVLLESLFSSQELCFGIA